MSNTSTEKKKKESKFGKLLKLAVDKDLADDQQRQIAESIIGVAGETFAELSEEEATHVFETIDSDGLTYWINKATGQTDITDPDQQITSLQDSGEESLADLTVYDDEEGGMVTVAAETRKVANGLQQRMDVATLMTAVVMMRMSDEKLYRGVDKGYSSFREYAEVRCPFGYRQAQRYAQIGRRFSPMLPDGVTSMSPDQQALNGNVQTLSELGMTKLYELSKIEDADFTELPSEGKVKLKDGSELDIEEIKSQSARQFKRKVDEYREYMQDQEAELNKTAKERDEAIAEKEKMERESEVGRKYKAMYGEKSEQFEAYKNRIMTARSKATDLNQALSKIKDLPPEFDSLVDELRDLHRMMDRATTHLREDNIEAFDPATTDNQ